MDYAAGGAGHSAPGQPGGAARWSAGRGREGGQEAAGLAGDGRVERVVQAEEVEAVQPGRAIADRVAPERGPDVGERGAVPAGDRPDRVVQQVRAAVDLDLLPVADLGAGTGPRRVE